MESKYTVFIYDDWVIIDKEWLLISALLDDQSKFEYLRNKNLTICVIGKSTQSVFMFGYFCGLTSTKITKYIKE